MIPCPAVAGLLRSRVRRFVSHLVAVAFFACCAVHLTYGQAPYVFSFDGTLATPAGNGTQGYSGDNQLATTAELNAPIAVAADAAGNVYIVDQGNSVIRKLTVATGNISTIAGNGTPGYTGDGGAASAAELHSPAGITVDANGNLYIADMANNVIRKVDVTSGVITTIAGNGTAAYSGDGGPALSAGLNQPNDVKVDGAGNIYIADSQNSVIRRVNASGNISTIAGNGNWSFSGDGGSATSASMEYPQAIALDAAGNLYIADFFVPEIRKVNLSTGIITAFAGTGSVGLLRGWRAGSERHNQLSAGSSSRSSGQRIHLGWRQ